MNIADSPATTQAVVATGVGSGLANWMSIVPEIVSLIGGLIAATAGVYLILRHHSKRKLNDSERRLRDQEKLVEIQQEKIKTHEAEVRRLQAEQLQLQNEEVRRRLGL